MISFLTMIANTIVGALLYALKAFFSLVLWFGRTFVKVLKLFFVVLPITSIVFIVLMLTNLGLFFFGGPPVDMPKELGPDADTMVRGGAMITLSLFNSLKIWWLGALNSNGGTASHAVIIILSILMFIPVICVLLCISVFMSYGKVLFISVVVDAILYMLMALLGKSFISQAMGRYYRLFPEAGKRHEEREHEKWIKKRNREFEQEERDRKRTKQESFYDDEPRYDEDDYDDQDESYQDDYDESDEFYEDEEADYYEDDRDYGGDYYEDEYEDDACDDDEEYDEGDYEEDFEDDYDEPKSRPEPAASTTFDFFAGCTSLESVNKKYKSLVKLYHPDNMDGDTAALQQINAQYAEAKKRFS